MRHPSPSGSFFKAVGAPASPRDGSLLPSALLDPVLRQPYGGQLEAAAEAFLLTAFEQATAQTFGETPGPNAVLVSAAMHILNRSAWTQPTDEQVKAAVYLGERHPDAGRGGPANATHRLT